MNVAPRKLFVFFAVFSITCVLVYLLPEFEEISSISSQRTDEESSHHKKISFSNCQTIHIVIIVDNTRKMAILLKSILVFRDSPLHLHFIVNSTDQFVVETLLNTWELPSVKCSFYPMKTFSKMVSNLFILTLPSILPLSVEKVIVLDSNVVVLSDVQKLWIFFDILKTLNKPFAAVKDSCSTSRFQKCFNTKVMLINLQAIRWSNTSPLVHENAMNYIYNSGLYGLPCQWNVNMTSDLQCTKPYRIIQYQSIFDLMTKINEYSFLNNKLFEYDSYLMKYLPVKCGNNTNRAIVRRIPMKNRKVMCKTLKEQSRQIFLTHYRFYDDQHKSLYKFDVTLITQLTTNRILQLYSLLQHWDGPVSITLYGTEAEVWKLTDYLDRVLSERKVSNVAIHIVYKREGYFYPVNYLRNVALKGVRTPYILIIDGDFLPSYGLYPYLRKAAELLMTTKRALVVPAFEAQENIPFPRNKSTLVKLMKKEVVRSFHPYFEGHTPTNYTKWVQSSYPYIVKWAKNYEPYVFVGSDIVKYDQTFVGYGWNKVSHIAELKAQGYEFVVLPDPFILHYPHPRSSDYRNWNGVFKMCTDTAYRSFISQLQEKYGHDCFKINEREKVKDIHVKINNY